MDKKRGAIKLLLILVVSVLIVMCALVIRELHTYNTSLQQKTYEVKELHKTIPTPAKTGIITVKSKDTGEVVMQATCDINIVNDGKNGNDIEINGYIETNERSY